MMKVGDKFEQDGKKYVAETATAKSDDFICEDCAFKNGTPECVKSPACIDHDGINSINIIFVEVKK